MYISILNPFGYRGYCYDGYAGFYYLQSRYYDTNTGRFINADDTNYLNATGTVLGCNLFAYCENDAVNYIDENGYYSRENAVEYAKKYYLFYNSNYYTYSQDCTNFVSQCLYAGGISMTDKWYCYSKLKKYKNELDPDLGWDLDSLQKGRYWNVSETWRLAHKCYEYFRDSKITKDNVKITKKSNLKKKIEKYNIKIGDIIFFNSGEKKAKMHHAAIITKIKDNKIYYAAHSSPHKAKNLDKYLKNEKYVRILTIKEK